MRHDSVDQVFNGVFYNLDAVVESTHLYEHNTELYEFYEKIGDGGFCDVHRATFIPTGEEMAVKILRESKLTPQIIQLTKQEAELLDKLDHPNIVKVQHLIQLNGKFYMGMDYLGGGSLQGMIKEKNAAGIKFTDQEASLLMKSILQAVEYFHSQDIIHRDLKPQNILI